MASRKKSSANQPKPDEDASSSSAQESAENEGVAHVRADELAGSPDIFAPSAEKATAGSVTSSSVSDEPEAAAEPQPVPEPEPEAEPVKEQAALEAHVEPEAAPVAPMPAQPAGPPPPTFAPAPGAQRGRAGTGVALGIVFVVVGLFFLLVRLVNVDLGAYR